jgi:hypothetical protein
MSKYESRLYKFELNEVKSLKQDLIYYAATINDRTIEEVALLKGIKEDEITKEFDDEEGYYNVDMDEHLAYRYEVLKILGKGSFA